MVGVKGGGGRGRTNKKNSRERGRIRV